MDTHTKISQNMFAFPFVSDNIQAFFLDTNANISQNIFAFFAVSEYPSFFFFF